jgi:DNA-binding NtrC family response regulator
MLEPDEDTLEDNSKRDDPAACRLEPHLFVVVECDRPGAGGARYSLAGLDEVLVGRGPARSASKSTFGGVARLLLQVPGRCMSTTHARFRRETSGFCVEDAGSKNGTFVNGQRVTRASLQEGDIVELGHTLFILEPALPTPIETVSSDDALLLGRDLGRLHSLLPALAQKFALLLRAARSSLPIVLLGETGSGKEVAARAVHSASGRPGPFVALNCGALSAQLVESHLFGHVRGAFTGAVRDEQGFFRAANGGTLLLDEIGDLPLQAQSSLLRVLQEREVTPVGSSHPVPVNVRVIAATHRPLDAWTADERFRRDLLARLTGFRVRLPPLRERRHDLGVLLADILGSACQDEAKTCNLSELRLSPSAGLSLLRDSWPSNIRELAQHVRRALVLADGQELTEEHLGLSERFRAPTAVPSVEPPKISGADLQLKRELLLHLEAHRGNVSNVAQAMGKKRMQVHRWMRRFGVDVDAFRATPPASKD